MPEREARNLLQAIREFVATYGDNPRFRPVLEGLQSAATALREIEPGDEESPGRRAAREAGGEPEGREGPPAPPRRGGSPPPPGGPQGRGGPPVPPRGRGEPEEEPEGPPADLRAAREVARRRFRRRRAA